MKKSVIAFCVCALAALFVTSCSKKSVEEIVVYTNPEFPPYEYMGANGEIVGAEIDLVHRIAAKLGKPAKIVSAEFDSIITTVKTGKADMGASGFTITEERKKEIDFSIPFISSVQYLIVPEDSPINVVEDLAGKKIGGQNGTTGYMMVETAIAKGILQGTGASANSYNNAPDAMVAMANKRVDAVVIDELVAISLAKKNPGYKAIPLVKADGNGLDEPEEFGIIVAKGHPELLAVINEVITEMREDGSLAAAIEKHNAASAVEE